MSKSSTATVREQPVAGATSVSGALRIIGETLTVTTESRIHVLDLTDQVMALVRKLRISEGTVSLVSLHTTCTVFINEFQPALVADITKYLEEVVDSNGSWLHNDPRHSDCDRRNADSHLRALLLGHSLTMQVSGGELVLGQWQRILMAELDGPRTRTLRIQVMGVA
jgi:secondary thiamine-phosphate synthase enzyme